MLVLTENATSMIRRIVDRPELAEGAGLRIAPDADRPQRLAVTAVNGPSDDDVVIDDHGARVFLDAAAAPILDDKVLDVGTDGDGGVEFVLSGP